MPAAVGLVALRVEGVLVDLVEAGVRVLFRIGADPVLDRRVADHGVGDGAAGRSVDLELDTLAHQLPRPLLAQVLGEPEIGERHLLAAPDDDGLELLGAHHGAESGARRGATLVGDDAREEGHGLAGGSDAGDRGVLAVSRPEVVLRVQAILAPERRGVVERHLAVVDEHVGRRPADAAEEDRVVAGEAQVRPPGAAAIGVAPAAGERRLADHGEAAAADRRRPGERPGDEAEQVVRAERVDAGRHALVEDPRAEAVAPDEVPGHLRVQGFHAARPRLEVDEQELAHVAVDRHSRSSGPGRAPPASEGSVSERVRVRRPRRTARAASSLARVGQPVTRSQPRWS